MRGNTRVSRPQFFNLPAPIYRRTGSSQDLSAEGVIFPLSVLADLSVEKRVVWVKLKRKECIE
jgi:hypothetical protein